MSATYREAVAVFDTAEALDAAVFALETHGFDRAAFSLLASEEAVEQKLGHRYQLVKEMEDNPAAPRDTFYSRISRLEATYLPAPALAAIGGLMFAGATVALPAVIAAGGGFLLGAAMGGLIHHHHAARVKEQLERGGLVLWVGVRDAAQEEKALQILREHSAHDVHAHEVQL
ncbi:hypothetical protein GCM10010909_27290 [Acidocella aquatica]|uniref:DUF1269 domain-containing protein n=1 Tax=Acidocella aquatica TaxID=1922313 RepID=A0ABQ6A8W7_9PROT|nr:hypothetical protein [Acidocella aquatica]GLR68048.1 hypothetical protein GCM10010909_27290 [Acidocella aquatica]